jgi:integrase
MGKRLRRGFFWRGSVVWVRTDPIDKLPRSTGSHDPEAAYLWRAERERLVASPVYAASRAASFGSWVVKILELKRAERSAGTLEMYEVKLGHFVRIWGEHAALASVTPEAVDSFIKQRRAEGAKSNTIARELSCLRQLLRHAKRAGHYAADVREVMPIGFAAEYVPVKRTLKLEDLPRLWEALQDDTERAFVALALGLAADTGDIRRARPEDYDRVRGVMRVRGTKTVSRDAEVPVLPHVRELVEWAVERLPIDWPRASKGVGEACKRARLPHLSPKDLRRTAASWLVATGADPSLVSRFLRHRSDAMVRLVYGQVTPTELGSLLTTSAETLQSNARPLGGMADARDLKDASTGVGGGAESEDSGSYGPDAARDRAVDSADPLQLSEALRLARAARAALWGRGKIGNDPVPVQSAVRLGKKERDAG